MGHHFAIQVVSPTKGDYPFSPYVQIGLVEHIVDSEGKLLLSPQLMSEKEIDDSIDTLMDGLNKLRDPAKSALRLARNLSE